MATITDIGALITRNPEIRGGRPRVAGTGVSVRTIAVWHQRGLTPEEIADQFGHLSLAQIHAALAYYHANREEIEDDLKADEDEADRIERLWAEEAERRYQDLLDGKVKAVPGEEAIRRARAALR